MAAAICAHCGRANDSTAVFCAVCGTALAAGEPDDSAVTRPLPIVADDEEDEHRAEAAVRERAEEAQQRVRRRAAEAGKALAAGSALLLVTHGPTAGSRFLLDRDLTTAGRHPTAEIFLDDVTVSRHHAEFHRHGEDFTVRDAGSLNGTYVNRERVEKARLASGDEIQIGSFRLLFLAV